MKATFFVFAILSASVAAQPAKAPPSPPPSTPNFCDVTYATEVEDSDHNEVSSSAITLRAIPWVDVQDNHQKGLKVLDVLSKQQDKGGPYIVTVTETNTCDGGAVVRIPSGSAYVEGVTLDGSNKVARESLKQADSIVKRYEDRSEKGGKTGWNHKNANKVKRNDLGQKIN